MNFDTKLSKIFPKLMDAIILQKSSETDKNKINEEEYIVK
jgi:hypothetical protein